jgi:hypothetical protein
VLLFLKVVDGLEKAWN